MVDTTTNCGPRDQQSLELFAQFLDSNRTHWAPVARFDLILATNLPIAHKFKMVMLVCNEHLGPGNLNWLSQTTTSLKASLTPKWVNRIRCSIESEHAVLTTALPAIEGLLVKQLWGAQR